MKNMKKLITTTLIAFALIASVPAQAQWSASFNLGYLFDASTNSPQMLFKKSISNGNAAIRFSVGGEIDKSQDLLNFYKSNKYTNLNQWPSKVEDEVQYDYKRSEILLAPGIELRTNISEKNMVYYGLDLMFFMRNSENEQVNYYSSYNAGTEMYTINTIYVYNNSSKRTEVMPKIFLGVSRNLGHNISIMAEASINGSMRQNQNMNTNESWNWNGAQFVNNAPDDEFEENDEPWDMSINWLPSFDFWFTYTFGSK